MEIDLDWDGIKTNSPLGCVGFALGFCLFITLSETEQISSYFTPKLAFLKSLTRVELARKFK